MSTKEMAYSMIDTLTEEQLQEVIAFLKGYKKKTASVESVRGILSEYANPDLIAQEESAWERAVVENYEAP